MTEAAPPGAWRDEATGLVFAAPPDPDTLLCFEYTARGEWVMVRWEDEELPVHCCASAELAAVLAERGNALLSAQRRAQAHFAAGGLSGRA